jgi:LytS/YehU family sensor histidine kinase
VDIDSNGYQLLFIFRDFITAFAVIICILVIRIIYQNQQNRLEIQNLQLENLQSQFEALKNQISPHFLFNSLNSLNALIHEAPDVAKEYLSHLSAVLRYTLQANENKLVSVQDELKFVDSYFFLVKLRYGNNIELHQKLSDTLMSYKMPPLAIQILIENAVKHNEISKRNPLEIFISEITNETIQIKNNINVKYNQEKGTGLGLANLTNQYRILSGKEITIRKDDKFFSVELPIFKI